MTTEQILQATKIILKSNSPKASFQVPIKNSYNSVYDILIHESNASLINELIEAGFSLSMTKKGLSVTKY